MDLQAQLSRRERQIMDIVYGHGEAPGAEPRTGGTSQVH